ncbi:UNVERIFIED_CONTAM: 2-(3-amino-3-carboxypropyl)histidine synthase subunit 1, partial [Eudyptes robustus]
LPKNYTFEIPKTIWKIKTTGSKYVALQLPEGLLLYACIISDILTKHTGCEVFIMGDVTYGACCVDDYTARALGCTLLVHYGHSCLVPIQDTQGIHLLYIFVNININLSHAIDSVVANVEKEKKMALVSTVQFVTSLNALKKQLESMNFSVYVPQCSPLSPGEILGCTSPKLSEDTDYILYVGDGRFHLESIMIQNPRIKALQYNPYSRILSAEEYGFDMMLERRKEAVRIARLSKVFGIIQGTLGRQGNAKIFNDMENKLKEKDLKFVRILMSEIFSPKLKLFNQVECWAQVACPRLSIDWGMSFERPLLTPFELSWALNYVEVADKTYPMDFYAFDSLGPWTNNHSTYRPQRAR